MATYKSFSDLINAWGGTHLQADIGVKAGLPSVWKHRNSVPARYWPRLVTAAEKRGIPGITFDLLESLSDARGVQ
jgi:hypothetical protein